MTTLAGKHADYSHLDELKQKWLERLALPPQLSVIDCDVDARKITMLVDGEPVTRQLVEKMSRVMGYHRPVHTWNIGKQSEHAERLLFQESKAAIQ